MRKSASHCFSHLADWGVVAANARGELAIAPSAGAALAVGQVGLRVQLAARKERSNVPATHATANLGWAPSYHRRAGLGHVGGHKTQLHAESSS